MPEPKYNREDHLNSRQVTSIDPQEITEHLNELRNRILIAVASFIIATIGFFYFSSPIIRFLEAAAPLGSSFFQLKPGELFTSSLKVSVFAGVIISMPIWLGQLEEFIRPGLKDNELGIIKPILRFSPLLFWLGVAFAYYLVLPPLLSFLLGFGQGVIETRYGLEHFINLELSILSICGITFQLPIILIILCYFRILHSSQLLSAWRYVILGAFTISAVITPTPDPFTMSILAGALLVLYFLTIAVLRVMKH
jgi:sec-independent protein translocase protein TatC